MALPLSEMTLEEALRSYSSVKGHRTRVEREIGKLLRLLKDQYSATSEERLNDRIDKLEKHIGFRTLLSISFLSSMQKPVTIVMK